MLDQAFPETGHYSQGAQTFIEKITQFSLCFDLGKETVEQTTDNNLNTICEEHSERTQEEELLAIKLLTKKLPTDGVVNWRGKFNQSCLLFDSVDSVDTWRSAFLAMLESCRAIIREAESIGTVCTLTENSVLKPKNTKPAANDTMSKRAAKRHRDDSSTVAVASCTGCGRNNHRVETCNFTKSQFFNKSPSLYTASEVYKKLAVAYPTMKYNPV